MIAAGRPPASGLAACGAWVVALLLPLGASAGTPATLSLDQALAAARSQHPGLRAGRAQKSAAQAQVGEAFSGYLPRIDLFAQYQRSTANLMPTPGMAGLVQASAAPRVNLLGLEDAVDYLSFGTVLTQPIYDFGKTGGRVEAARAQDSFAQASLEATEQDVAVSVRVAYYGVLATQQALVVAEETRQNHARHLQQIRQLVEAGSRTRYDLVSAEQKIDDAELSLLRAQNALSTARVKLDNAMGQESELDYEVVEPAAEEESLELRDSAELLDEAEARRPELAKSAAQIASRRADEGAARAGYFPDLVATGSFAGAKVDDLDTGLNWYLGAGLSWRVFEGLRTYRRSESTSALRLASEAEHERLRQAVRLEIQVQRMAVDEASKRQKVAQHAVEVAAERLRLAEGRYGAGSGSVLDLEDAQVAQTNARFQAVQARYDLSVARVLLRRAVGS